MCNLCDHAQIATIQQLPGQKMNNAQCTNRECAMILCSEAREQMRQFAILFPRYHKKIMHDAMGIGNIGIFLVCTSITLPSINPFTSRQNENVSSSSKITVDHLSVGQGHLIVVLELFPRLHSTPFQREVA